MTSKSQEKRVAAQKSTQSSLEVRVKTLEAQVKELLGAFEYAANECRPIYGMGGLAIIFDAIVKRAKK